LVELPFGIHGRSNASDVKQNARLAKGNNIVVECCGNRLPSSAGGGVAEGRGGVVKKFLDHTTPSARTDELRDFFLIVQPPFLLLLRNCKMELMFSTASKTANLRQNTGKYTLSEFLSYYRTAPLSLLPRRGAWSKMLM
jgi:hypothetical protein